MTRRWIVAAIACASVGPSDAAPPGSVVRVEHRDPSAVPTRGPKSALVQIELFFVPNTNAQARLPSLRALERLQAKHPTRVRLIYRVLKRGAQQQISIAAQEAHAQGKFAAFVTELYLDRTTTMLTKDRVIELARKAGLDTTRLATAISEGRYDDVFDANERRLARLAHAENPQAPAVLFNARAPRASLGAPNDNDLEREYVQAYERALDLIERGVPARQLQRAFDAQALRSEQPFVFSTNIDDDAEEAPATEHKLARPPLSLTGLPRFGKVSATPSVPVVLLCRPNDVGCFTTMRLVRKLQEIYADEVGLVWAPWFDVSHENAAELSLLGDAALCAEQIGTSPDEFDASPGWHWITRQLEVLSRAHGRRFSAERLIDAVASDLEIDSLALARCRARIANTTLDWIARARRSGVSRSPAIVIGGRIYEGLNDSSLIQQLIEAELAPGTLARCATIGCSTD